MTATNPRTRAHLAALFVIGFTANLLAQTSDPFRRDGRPSPRVSDDPFASAKTDGPDAVLVNLWLVQFDESVATSDLPIDVRALSQSAPEHLPVVDGRIQTTGLARQMKISEFAVRVNGHALTMRDGKLVSHSDGDAPGAPPWQFLTAPRIMLAVGQQGVVSAGKAVSYLARGEGGCLTVESDPNAVEGVEISLTSRRADAREARFEDIRLRVTRVAQREAIDGVPFDVGRPVLDTRETSLGLTIPYDQIGIIPLPQGHKEPPMLVFLTCSVAEAASTTR